jgi:fructokinase
MADVIALGELLIDFVPTVSGVSLIEAPAFQKAPGGAPANVAVGLAKLGASAGFLGKVGDDAFGHFLAQTLAEHGVDISGVRFDPEARTALAFVSLRADGEREFMFYRHPSADMRYRPDEVDIEALRRAKIFHFGSISLIGEPSRSATLLAVQTARESGLRISFDPNLRLNLWRSEDEARQRVLETLPLAQVVKIAEEELHFLTGIAGLEAAARALWRPGLELLVVTLGAAGCRYFTAEGSGEAGGFTVQPVDTTGAGDGFVAGLLYGLLHSPESPPPLDRLYEICRFANAVGALTTTRRGAIPALPTLLEVRTFMAGTG